MAGGRSPSPARRQSPRLRARARQRGRARLLDSPERRALAQAAPRLFSPGRVRMVGAVRSLTDHWGNDVDVKGASFPVGVLLEGGGDGMVVNIGPIKVPVKAVTGLCFEWNPERSTSSSCEARLDLEGPGGVLQLGMDGEDMARLRFHLLRARPDLDWLSRYKLPRWALILGVPPRQRLWIHIIVLDVLPFAALIQGFVSLFAEWPVLWTTVSFLVQPLMQFSHTWQTISRLVSPIVPLARPVWVVGSRMGRICSGPIVFGWGYAVGLARRVGSMPVLWRVVRWRPSSPTASAASAAVRLGERGVRGGHEHLLRAARSVAKMAQHGKKVFQGVMHAREKRRLIVRCLVTAAQVVLALMAALVIAMAGAFAFDTWTE